MKNSLPNSTESITLFWFRRDLRVDDNHALYKALKENTNVLPIFIFDTNIIQNLPQNDHRLTLIYNQLKNINNFFIKHFHKQLYVFKGDPETIFKKLIDTLNIKNVYANDDYEPYAKKRDKKIKELFRKAAKPIHFYTDHLIFSPKDITTNTNGIYKVYTPFAKKWMSKFQLLSTIPEYPSENYLQNLISINENYSFPELEQLGFKKSSLTYTAPKFETLKSKIKNYHITRDVIELDYGTSHVSTALRFGFISIRNLVRFATENPKYLNELIWREFFQYIIYHYPETAKDNFKINANIPLENNVELFEKWKNAETGYLLIDAAMNQLNTSGFMHNRLRMLTANFLCKILWVDWRWGERYFAQKLFDYELASNVGNWQWASGTGVDSAPYFRIFNPELQLKKFDANLKYINKWLPYQITNKPPKIVDYTSRRNLYLNMMKTES
jgi:deoxyribodipyrimidine photo-lyase